MFKTIWTDKINYINAQELEDHTWKFAGRVLEGLRKGRNMTCSSKPKPDQVEKKLPFGDLQLATGAIKAF